MSAKYVDYYNKYINTHSYVKEANKLACTCAVTNYLRNNTSLIINSVKSKMIKNPTDITMHLYNAFMSLELEVLNKILDYSDSYSNVENAYVQVNQLLNKLKSQNELFSSVCNSKPSFYDKKYEIITNYETGYDKNRYYNDLYNWEREVDRLSDDCILLDNKIKDYLNYIKKSAKIDPTKDVIPSSGIGFIPKQIQPKLKYMSDDEIVVPEPRVLEGEELIKFFKDNKLIYDQNLEVVNKTVVINGVLVNTYNVYNINSNSRTQKAFSKYIDDCLECESKIDPAILSTVFEGDDPASIIFIEDKKYDEFLSGDNNAAAYYRGSTRTIVQPLLPIYEVAVTHCIDFYTSYYAATIVHETGHAYDHKLGDRYDGDSYFYSESSNTIINQEGTNKPLTWQEIVVDEVNYFEEQHNDNPCKKSFSTEAEAQKYYNNYCLNASEYEVNKEGNEWVLYVKYNKENNESVTFSDGQNGSYTVHDYLEMPYEYFADAFQAYWLGDKNIDRNKLDYLCPETSAALGELVKKERENYYGELIN